MGPLIVLIVLMVVLVVGGAIAVMRRSKRAAVTADAGTGPNEFLQSPPTSFPAATDAEPAVTSEPGAGTGVEAEPAEPAAVDQDGDGTAHGNDARVIDDGQDDRDDDGQDDRDDEAMAARFRAPGTRSAPSTRPAEPVAPPAHPVEDRPVDDVERSGSTDSTESVESSASSESSESSEVVETGGPVIDLSGEQAVVTPAEGMAVGPTAGSTDTDWDDVVLQPEPDAVDHVLQALINRARFKQVEVEAVATELVERADLQGQEVSEVLAELVGRAGDSTLDSTIGAARTSELTLFNDEVPSRPGQLTDFARLAPADKKRIIVRVLCLLVARSEDQALPPRAEDPSSEPRSWPLARAVWPLATSGHDGEAQLPSRRLAKSG